MISRYSRIWLALVGALLFGGPVLAGLAGHGWKVLPVFAALFLLFNSATRKPDLATGAGWAGLVMMAGIQGVLVSLTWVLGLAAGALFGAIYLPVWAPIAVTALAAGIGVWAFRDAAEMDVMLDSVLNALNEKEAEALSAASLRDPWPAPSPEAEATVEQALEDLRKLGRLDESGIAPILTWLEAGAGAGAFDPFYDAAGQEGSANEPVVDFALLRFVSSPAMLRELVARGEGGLAPILLMNAPSAPVRAEARARLAELITLGAPAEQLPAPALLAELAERFPGEGFERLAEELASPAGL